jgi:hypothetical protein
MNMTEVIKVQRPLSSNDLGNPWLLYDKGRVHVVHTKEALMDKTVRAAMGNAIKGYFEAEWSSEGWKIGKKARDQDW